MAQRKGFAVADVDNSGNNVNGGDKLDPQGGVKRDFNDAAAPFDNY